MFLDTYDEVINPYNRIIKVLIIMIIILDC